MPTREQVLQLLGTGLSYEEAAQRLGVRPGLAYLIATGIAADGSDSVTDEQRSRPGFLPTSQQLANGAAPAHPARKPHVLEWMKQRASSDAQMQAAAASNRTTPPDTDVDDASYDLIDVITRDHDQVNSLVKELSSVPSPSKGGTDDQVRQRQLLADALAIAVTGHERAEDACLWPTVRNAVPDGEGLAAQAHEQEQEGLQTLTALAKADPAGDEFDDVVQKLSGQLRKHVAFEDRVLLALRSVTGAQEREELGRRFRGIESEQPETARPPARSGKGKHSRKPAPPRQAADDTRSEA